MVEKNKRPKDLSKIASGAFSRGMTLLNVTLASGAKFAGLKIQDAFLAKEDKPERMKEFLKDQADLLVRELGKLKGSIMKAGQMLSVYGEHFLPPEVNQVLKKLQAETRPLVWEEMEKTLKAQLGKDIFKKLTIDTTPIAAASLGQVYRAYSNDRPDEPFALKIQYPGVEKAIDSDLNSLKSILALTKLVPLGPSFEEIFKEIRMMLHYEVDYVREGTIIDTYRNLLQGDERFIVPKIYREYSSSRVITMSLEEGVILGEEAVASLSQKRRNLLGAGIMDLMFREIFQWRLVQTDPHFGNYKIRLSPDGKGIDKWVLLDFGAVRKFPIRYISPFAKLVHAALMENAEGVVQAGIQLGFVREKDPAAAKELFVNICMNAIEGYTEKYTSPELDGSVEGDNPYNWGNTDLLSRLTMLAKDAVFTFKLRPPPREAIFLDRKMVGTFTMVSQLKLRFGPRKLAQKYTEPYLQNTQSEEEEIGS